VVGANVLYDEIRPGRGTVHLDLHQGSSEDLTLKIGISGPLAVDKVMFLRAKTGILRGQMRQAAVLSGQFVLKGRV
jgi:hypothetical protein